MLSGGCHCGAVRYAIEAEPLSCCYCHCESCRRSAGALMVAWLTVSRTGFRITRGQLHDVQSSPGVHRGRCGACGSPLTYAHDDRGEELCIRVL